MLASLDSKVVDMLSEGSSFINRSPPVKPSGRPAMVPGAMNFDTMLKFQERTELIELIKNGKLSAMLRNGEIDLKEIDVERSPILKDLLKNGSVSGYTVSTQDSALNGPSPPAAPPSIRPTVEESEAETSSTAVFGSFVKGSRKTATNEIDEVVTKKELLYADGSSVVEKPKKARKKVVKNLPKPRKDREVGSTTAVESTADKKSRASGVNLQRYYRTELLTAQEEYSLGMKVRFMVKCEQVHEGLALHLQRLPTIEEWANACG
jgi:hypothetical protein